MAILSRCSNLLVAHLHALLDQAEDPEVMLGQLLRDMEKDLAEARRQAVRVIAAERWLDRELAEQRRAIELWQTRAREAVAAQRDDLARMALVRKQELERAATELNAQHTSAVEASTQARIALQDREALLSAARRKHRALIARFRAAQARRALRRIVGKRADESLTPAAPWQSWEERLNELENFIAAEEEVQSLADEAATFAAWENESEVDHALAALKEETARK